jgi:transposase-like protein
LICLSNDKYDSFRFVIGREKDVENSEILRLIQQSLQMDQERNEIARALQHHQDTFNERHIHDDGFSNLELTDQEEQEKIDENLTKLNNHQELAKAHEKNYEVRSILLLFLIIKKFSSSKFGR